MKTVTCHRCNEVFGLADETDATLRRSGHTFYCPWGHPGVYSRGETEADKLRRERDRLKQETARLADEVRMAWNTVDDQHQQKEAARRSASAYRGQLTKIKNRVGRGVCPCCNRTFENLQRHMASKHAGFVAEEVKPEGVMVQ